VDNRHESFRHACRILMLDDITSVDYPCRALLNKRFGAFEDFLIRRFTTASNQNGYASRNFNYLVIQTHVIRGIRLDDIGAQFDGLPDQGKDLDFIAINHIAASDAFGEKQAAQSSMAFRSGHTLV
jgi:hypothetical protein